MSSAIAGARSGGFALALVCVWMPFVTLSCPIAQFTFTGSQMAFGTTVEAPQPSGPPTRRRVPPEPLAAVAATSAAAGVVVGLLSGGTARVICTAIAVAGGSLLGLKAGVETQTRNETLGFLTVTFEGGYWGALIGYATALVLNLVLRSATRPGTGAHA